MIKFGIDVRKEIFILNADDTNVEGALSDGVNMSHEIIVDSLLEDFGIINEGLWRFDSSKYEPGVYTGVLTLRGDYDSGDYDLLLSEVKKIYNVK